jgi:hypothetical protein
VDAPPDACSEVPAPAAPPPQAVRHIMAIIPAANAFVYFFIPVLLLVLSPIFSRYPEMNVVSLNGSFLKMTVSFSERAFAEGLFCFLR